MYTFRHLPATLQCFHRVSCPICSNAYCILLRSDDLIPPPVSASPLSPFYILISSLLLSLSAQLMSLILSVLTYIVSPSHLLISLISVLSLISLVSLTLLVSLCGNSRQGRYSSTPSSYLVTSRLSTFSFFFLPFFVLLPLSDRCRSTMCTRARYVRRHDLLATLSRLAYD